MLIVSSKQFEYKFRSSEMILRVPLSNGKAQVLVENAAKQQKH
jgi:hypothetical protein